MSNHITSRSCAVLLAIAAGASSLAAQLRTAPTRKCTVKY